MVGAANSTRGPILAIAATLSIGSTGCNSLDGEPSFEEFDFGVDVDLEAAVDIGTVYAVGANVVVNDGGESWQLGERLHDITEAGEHLVVVGDAGFVALVPSHADPLEHEFVQHETGITRDLVAVAGYRLTAEWPAVTVIVVGDGVLGVGHGDPEAGPLVWSLPDAPAGEWGSLRDLRTDSGRTCALGDAGALFCADSSLDWERIDLDLDTHLTRFCSGFLWLGIGTHATVFGDQDGTQWSVSEGDSDDWRLCSLGVWGTLSVTTTGTVVIDDLDTYSWTPDWQPLAVIDAEAEAQGRLIVVGEHGRGVWIRGSNY